MASWPQIIIGLPVRTHHKYSRAGPRIAAKRTAHVECDPAADLGGRCPLQKYFVMEGHTIA